MTDERFGRAIALGIVVGAIAMFVVSTGIVLIGGQDLGVSALIGLWVGLMIGPYAGGLAMLSREKQDEDESDAHAPAEQREHDDLLAA